MATRAAPDRSDVSRSIGDPDAGSTARTGRSRCCVPASGGGPARPGPERTIPDGNGLPAGHDLRLATCGNASIAAIQRGGRDGACGDEEEDVPCVPCAREVRSIDREFDGRAAQSASPPMEALRLELTWPAPSDRAWRSVIAHAPPPWSRPAAKARSTLSTGSTAGAASTARPGTPWRPPPCSPRSETRRLAPGAGALATCARIDRVGDPDACPGLVVVRGSSTGSHDTAFSSVSSGQDARPNAEPKISPRSNVPGLPVQRCARNEPVQGTVARRVTGSVHEFAGGDAPSHRPAFATSVPSAAAAGHALSASPATPLPRALPSCRASVQPATLPTVRSLVALRSRPARQDRRTDRTWPCLPTPSCSWRLSPTPPRFARRGIAGVSVVERATQGRLRCES